MLQGEGFQLPPWRGHDKRQQGIEQVPVQTTLLIYFQYI